MFSASHEIAREHLFSTNTMLSAAPFLSLYHCAATQDRRDGNDGGKNAHTFACEISENMLISDSARLYSIVFFL